MYFRNCWYAAILESDTGNPKLKTGHDQTVSLFKINRYNCPEVRLCSRIKKKKLLNRFQFGSDNPNLCTKVGKMFRAFFGVLHPILKQVVFAPFLAMRVWSTKRISLRICPSLRVIRYLCYP